MRFFKNTDPDVDRDLAILFEASRERLSAVNNVNTTASSNPEHEHANDSAPETHSGSTTLITSASEPKNSEGGDVSYDDDAATETVDASSRPMSRGRQTLMISRSRYSAGRPSKRTVRCK